MQAQEALRALRRGRLVGHRQRGGVGREEGVVLDDPVQLAPHLQLAVEVLGDRLDHQVAVREVAVVERGRDPPADRVGVGLLHLALVDRPGELLLDLGHALVELLLVQLAHDDVPAGLGADLGDPVAHQAAAENADRLDLHRGCRHLVLLLFVGVWTGTGEGSYPLPRCGPRQGLRTGERPATVFLHLGCPRRKHRERVRLRPRAHCPGRLDPQRRRLLWGRTTGPSKPPPSPPSAKREKLRRANRQQKRPNVIVIMTDDQNNTMQGLRQRRLAAGAQGTSFANSYASYPLCCPSRATFLTGQYAHNHGVRTTDSPHGLQRPRRQQHPPGLAAPLRLPDGDGRQVPERLRGQRRHPRAGHRRQGDPARLGRVVRAHRRQRPAPLPVQAERERRRPLLRPRPQELRHRRARRARRRLRQAARSAPEALLPLVQPDRAPRRGRHVLSEPAQPHPAPRHLGVYGDAIYPRTPNFDEDDVSDKPAARQTRRS